MSLDPDKTKKWDGHIPPRDGNGAPFPDSPREIHLLLDTDSRVFVPAGIFTVKKSPPSGMPGTGMGKHPLFPALA